jgi:predicted dehydrogenase
VGAGKAGHLHARVIGESGLTDLVAVVDPSSEAEALAYSGRAEWLTSLDDLLSAPPDFAIVAVPTRAHESVAARLLLAGIPTLVEKPLAEDVEAALRLQSIAEERGVLLGVGHVERFNPAVRALSKHLEEGTLGRVFQVHARRLSPFPIRIGDTGVAMDLATHDLDVMCMLAGRPLRIAAETDRKAHRTHEDLLAAVIRFETGIIGVLEVNWLTPDKVRQLTVTGERGMFVVDYLNQHLTLFENAQASEAWEAIAIFEGVTEGNVVRFAIPREEPLKAQLEAFANAVSGREPLEVTAEQGVRAVRLASAVTAAGVSGETIALD